MIQTKTKTTFQCTNCNANHAKQVGQCHFCKMWNCVVEISVEKKQSRIAPISAKRRALMLSAKNVQSDLDKWFDFQIKYELENGKCECQNCDKPVRHQLLSKDVWISRGTIAHVVPKRKIGGFSSVATHIHNFIILCLQCHNDIYDASWEKAVKSKVFPLAKKKFKLFQNSIHESTGKLPKDFFEN